LHRLIAPAFAGAFSYSITSVARSRIDGGTARPSSVAVLRFTTSQILSEAAPGADAIYILGSGWDTLGIVPTLEQDLGVPLVQPIAARIWEIQRRLHVRQPIKGYGILLETLPV
jgi:maleate cis-trans isomerase